MARDKSFAMLKTIIPDLVDNNGNMRITPIGAIGARNFSEDRLDVLRLLIKLLLTTNFVTEETKVYLRNRDISMKMVYMDLNNSGYYKGEDVNARKIINKISHDQSKVDKCLGENIVIDLLIKSKPDRTYLDAITRQMSSMGDSEERKKLIVKLNKSAMNTELKDDDFDEFLEVIQHYVKARVEKQISSLNDKQIGYFNYILCCPEEYLSDIDKTRKNRLTNLLDTGIMP